MARRARSSSVQSLVLRPQSPVRKVSVTQSSAYRKLQARLKSTTTRQAQRASKAEDALYAVAAPAIVGVMAANDVNLPSFGGFDPLLVWGAVGGLLGPMLVGGKLGERVGSAGIGLLAVAAHQAAKTGSFRPDAAVKSGPKTAAGDEIGYDDDED